MSARVSLAIEKYSTMYEWVSNSHGHSVLRNKFTYVKFPLMDARTSLGFRTFPEQVRASGCKLLEN